MSDKVKAIAYEPYVDVDAVFTAVVAELSARGFDGDAVSYSSGFERSLNTAWDIHELVYEEAKLSYASKDFRKFVVRKPGKRARVYKIGKDDTVNVKGIVDALLV